MPNKAELKIMRENREKIDPAAKNAGGTAFDNGLGAYYWSSTEVNKTHAWLQAFGFDTQNLMSKVSNTFNARAVQTVQLK